MFIVAEHAPLWGRDEEWAVLDRVLREPRSGVVLVDGTSGSGRTALLQQAVRVAARRGFSVLACGNLAACAPEPVLLSTRRADSCGEDVLVRLPGRLRSAIEARLPVGPVLVALDDLHEAEPAALCVLSDLPAQLRGRPIVWLLGRDGPRRPAQLDRLVLEGPDAADRVALAPLSTRAITRLTASVLAARPDAGMLQLLGSTGGVPLFVLDALQGLLDEGRVSIRSDVARVHGERLPQRVRTRAHTRLSHVTPDCMSLLQVVSTLGDDARIELAAALLGVHAATLLAPAEEAVSAGVLEWRGDLPSFTSPLWREVVGGTVPAPLDRVLRNQVEGLRAGPQDAPPGTEWHELSELQRTIAGLVAEGMTNQQVAHRVHLSTHTVNYHLRNVFRKLRITSRVELVRMAYDSTVGPRSA